MIQFIAAVLPALLLMAFIWFKDEKKEPLSRLVIAVCAGIAICVPVVFMEMAVKNFLFGGGEPTTLIGSTIQAFFVAAFPEEGFKLLALWLILRRNPYFDEHFDGIVYAVYVSLGFALVENIGYVASSEAWFSVATSRALLAVPGHYAFAVLMGYYYSTYHFVDRSPKTAVRILLVPVMAHGVYDAIAMSGSVNPLIGGIAFFVLVYFCIKMHRHAYTKLETLISRDLHSSPTFSE